MAVQLSFVENGNNGVSARRDLVAPFQSGQTIFLSNSPFLFPSISHFLEPCGHRFYFIFFIPFLFPPSTQAIEKAVVSSSGAGPPFLSFFSFPHRKPSLVFAPLLTLVMRHRISHLCLLLAFSCTLLGLLASAAPAPLGSSSTETLYRRQENGNPVTQPVVTQTVQTINTFVCFPVPLCAG